MPLIETVVTDFDTALSKFIKEVTAHRKEVYARKYGADKVAEGGLFEKDFAVYTEGNGRKYVKVLTGLQGHRSVFAFINKETGDVFKPASFNAPAKIPRGNIYATHFDGYGIIDGHVYYLK